MASSISEVSGSPKAQHRFRGCLKCLMHVILRSIHSVLAVWCRSHVEILFDELILRPSLRQVLVMLYGERRRFRSNDHESTVTRICKASTLHISF